MSSSYSMRRWRADDRRGRTFFLVVATTVLLVTISLLSHSFRGTDGVGTPKQTVSKRSDDLGTERCRDVHKAKDQCAFIRKYCPDEEAGLISYLELYYCSLPHLKPIGFLIILTWTGLLFTTIGVAASDFFCVNLSTIASILGMSESMAGVTFLAFGNGSPDVFSTFAAIKSHSGSLAVGELIGAAGFITAVVAGSMALVRPFKVPKRSFLRDVGFFAVSVGFSMYFLANGKLGIWECGVMVGFYCFYVATVIFWHWWLERQRRRREYENAVRGHFSAHRDEDVEYEEEYRDEPDTTLRRSVSVPGTVTDADFRDLEMAGYDDEHLNELEEESERDRWLGELNSNMRIKRPSVPHQSSVYNPIRPSLLGALEFRAVLSSLEKSRNLMSMPIWLRRYSEEGLGTPRRTADVSDVDGAGASSHRPSLITFGPDRRNRERAVTVNTPGLPRSSESASLTSTSAPSFEPYTDTEDGVPRSTLSPIIALSPPASTGSSDDESPHRERSHSDAHQTNTTTATTSQSRGPATRSRANTQDGPVPRISMPSRTSSGSQNLLAPPPIRLPSSRKRSKSQVTAGDRQPRSRRASPRTSPQTESYEPDMLRGGAREQATSTVNEPLLPPPAITVEQDPLYRVTSSNNEDEPKRRAWWPYNLLPAPEHIIHTLFPTLYDWKRKKWTEKLIGLASAPSFFLLTITLPVVEPIATEPLVDSADATAATNETSTTSSGAKSGRDTSTLSRKSSDSTRKSTAGVAVDIERSHHHTPVVSPTVKPLTPGANEGEGELHAHAAVVSNREWNRWLVLLQCVTAPLWILTMTWTTFEEKSAREFIVPALCCLIGSLVVLMFLLLTTTPTRPPRWHFVLCFVGFAVSVTWISTIANEVVGVLKTIGVIFDISDAILGLTIFAVGNSLGDLVADITVARLGYPVMALSACFGGPMLNILLGIGLSGLYMIITGADERHHEHPNKKYKMKPYKIEVNPTLLVSAVALLVTLVGLLVVVPANRWVMDKRIGWGLIALWCVSTVGNVVVEVTGVLE